MGLFLKRKKQAKEVSVQNLDEKGKEELERELISEHGAVTYQIEELLYEIGTESGKKRIIASKRERKKENSLKYFL